MMLFNIINFYSGFWVWHEYLIQKIFNRLVDLPIITRLSLINFFINKLSCLSLKRWLPGNDFTNKNTKAPDINLIWISNTSNNFRGSESRCPTNCKRFLSKLLEMLGKSIIYKSNMSPFLHRQNNIFWLQISIDNIIEMQIFQNNQSFSCIKLHIHLNLFVHFIDLI